MVVFIRIHRFLAYCKFGSVWESSVKNVAGEHVFNDFLRGFYSTFSWFFRFFFAFFVDSTMGAF